MNAIDIVCAAVIVLIAFFGVIRGFFSVLINLAAYFVALISAKLISVPLAQALYGAYVRAGVMEKLNAVLPEGSVSGGVGRLTETVISSLPEKLAGFAEMLHLKDLISNGVQGKDVLTVAEIEGAYVSPFLTKVLSILSFVVVFLILAVLLRVIAGLLDKALFKKKKGLLSTTNKLLGGIFGLIKGMIPAALVCYILNLLAPVLHSESFSALVSGSYLCGFVAKLIT